MIPALLAMSLQAGFDPVRLAAIPPRIKSFVDRGDVAGTVVLVARKGKTVLLDAEGQADLSTKRPMRPDTIFQVMSMTKPITALAVVMCAEKGLLNLDDPIDRILPEFKDMKVKGPDGSLKSPDRKPTLRHFLTHTSGYGGNDPGGLDDDAKRKLTLAEYASLLAKEPLVGEAGSAIRYSGPGMAALGRAVEVVSGMSLEEFERKEIFEPLGMKDTFFFLPEDRYPRVATVYAKGEKGLETIEPDPYRRGARFANPAGGLYSTAGDMAKLLNSVLGYGPRIVSAAAVDAMTAIQTGNLLMDGNDAQGFGLGFSVVRSPSGQMSLKPVGAFGHTGAFGTEFWADKERGIVAVFMAQGFDNTTAARKTFNTMVNAAFAEVVR